MILQTGSEKPMFAMGNSVRHKQAGFSLIEVIISVVILAFSAVFLYHAFFSSLVALTHMHNRFLADTLVNELEYSTKTKFAGQKTYHYTKQEDTRTLEGRKFTSVIDIERVPAVTGLYRMVIVVRWQENLKMVSIRREQLIHTGT